MGKGGNSQEPPSQDGQWNSLNSQKKEYPMSLQNELLITTWQRMVERQYQAEKAVGDNMADTVPVESERHKFTIADKLRAKQRQSRALVNIQNQEAEQPEAVVNQWDLGVYIDKNDDMMSPASYSVPVSQGMGAALGRESDQIKIRALNNSGTSNTIATSVGGASSGLNLDKVLRVNRIFNGLAVPREQRFMLITEFQTLICRKSHRLSIVTMALPCLWSGAL